MTVAEPIRTTETDSRSLITIHRLLLAAALIILLFSFAVYVVYAANLIAFPFDYDQGEGFELVDTIMFSQGQFPYQDTNVYPFYSSNYPPLFHVIAAPFVWLFGDAYWYGRLLGFLGTLVTAAAIGYAVYRDGSQRRSIALLSGLAFLASNTIYHIGPLFRQHMTMVLFETLAVVVLAHANEIEDTARRRRTIFAGLLLVIAAGYTKQLALATAVAVFAFLFIRQPRRAVIWGIGFALVGVGIFVGINLATNGEWWTQTIAANVNDFIPDQTFGLFRLWFSLHGFLLVPAVLYAVYELYFSRLSIYTLWFAASLITGSSERQMGRGRQLFRHLDRGALRPERLVRCADSQPKLDVPGELSQPPVRLSLPATRARVGDARLDRDPPALRRLRLRDAASADDRRGLRANRHYTALDAQRGQRLLRLGGTDRRGVRRHRALDDPSRHRCRLAHCRSGQGDR